jgi:transcriptional regulator with XRE-family HTH domain
MAAFADTIGTEQSTVSRYESGQLNPSRTVLILLLLLAKDKEQEPILAALGIGDDTQMKARITEAQQVLHRVNNLQSRHQLDSTIVEFAEEAAKMVSAGKPIERSLIKLLKLWQQHDGNRRLHRELAGMLPFFEFVANREPSE